MSVSEIAHIIFIFSAIEINIILLVVGVYLLINGIRKKMYNVLILAISFIIGGFSAFALVVFDLTFSQIAIPAYFSIMLYAPFTYFTFHRSNKRARIMVLIIFVFFLFKAYFGTFENRNPLYFILSQLFTISVTSTSVAWYGYSSLDAYRKLRDKSVKPYQKERLRIMAIVSFPYAVGVIVIRTIAIVFETNTQSNEGIVGALISFIVAIYLSIFAIGMLLTWFMPDWFRDYLNRGFSDMEETSNEIDAIELKAKQDKPEQIDMTNFLAKLLSDRINKNITICRGLIRMALVTRYSIIPSYLGFAEWLDVIRVELREKLDGYGIGNTDEITIELVRELIDNQSIITMTAI